MYEYRAQLLRVIDGDTVELNVDLGFGVHVHETFRLAGIDAPELRSPDAGVRVKARAAKEFLVQVLVGDLWVRTDKVPEKYGRWLATVRVGGTLVGGASVNERLVELGLAVPYDGGARG